MTPGDLRRAVACQICGKPAGYWATINGYRHFRCPSCLHIFVSPRPSETELESFYASGAYYGAASAEKERLVAEARARALMLEAIAERLNLPRALLDVGCATGFFLAAIHELGWQAAGVEQSPSTAALAADRVDCAIHRGTIETLEIPGSPFPVVTAWEVLEHARDPVEFFRSLSRNVMSGGVLALSTPRSDGIPARFLGARFPMLCPPEHLCLFSRRSLGLLAAHEGFTAILYSSFSNLTANSVASGLARLWFGKPIESLGGGLSKLLRGCARLSAWIPSIIDRAGYGSEMQVVLLKGKK